MGKLERRCGMRLIDADKFKEYLLESFEQNKDLFNDEQEKIARAITEGFLADIDEQPTAYDIDEVTQELCKKSFVDWEEEFVDNGECLIYLADAIEIVKGGK